MRIDEAILLGMNEIAAAGVEDARRESTLLLRHVLKRDAAFVIAHPEYELGTSEAAAFLDHIRRRASREPFHYITGVKEFYGLEFVVRPGVLIPRPETELLVEAALEEANSGRVTRFLEIGPGSGCIVVSILRIAGSTAATAVDISPIAVAVTGENARRHGVKERLDLVQGDLAESLDAEFDLVVTNPPYVPNPELSELSPEVAEYEPHLALFGGEDGLDVVRSIGAAAQRVLRPGSLLLMEIGYGQAEQVRNIFSSAAWDPATFIPDLQGIDRILTVRRGHVSTIE